MARQVTWASHDQSQTCNISVIRIRSRLRNISHLCSSIHACHVHVMCMSCACQKHVTYDPALKSLWLNDRVSVDRIQSQRLDTSFKIFFLCSTFIKDNKDIFVYLSYLFKLFFLTCAFDFEYKIIFVLFIPKPRRFHSQLECGAVYKESSIVIL